MSEHQPDSPRLRMRVRAKKCGERRSSTRLGERAWNRSSKEWGKPCCVLWRKKPLLAGHSRERNVSQLGATQGAGNRSGENTSAGEEESNPCVSPHENALRKARLLAGHSRERNVSQLGATQGAGNRSGESTSAGEEESNPCVSPHPMS